ncbi:uncharacterized protein LOC132714260 [Ruditapes philippinarum]|uniref:uncharacterized protein LOC132714260 n=1 Tax=Ruditapes philippinarum TaxID=129788 RepID=UPI00295B3109|nr:uncharacterized protein LOC132714260 [Ruditapes philippinarum]
MSRNFKLRDKTGEKSIQGFLQEKRIAQLQMKQIKRLERTRDVRLRSLEAESCILKEKLQSYGRGMTNLNSYYDKKERDEDKNTIWFPLERSNTDWEPRPCWIGESAVNQHSCLHFPCRTFTSYHFFHRQLPEWILSGANESVRKSKNSCDNLAENKKTNSKCVTKKDTITLPAIDFPENMTAKERKLKIIISNKRLRNELENKPADRSINYGKPTPVRRLQRPVRPCVRQMDILS